MLHVGEFVARIFDLDVSRANTGNPRTANLAFPQRIEQDRKSREVERMLRFHSFERDLILELAQVVAGRNDGRVDSEHMKPQAIRSAIVANLDDVALADLVQRLGKLVMLLAFLFSNGIEKRVPDFR
ncbi:MAG: hypothetical protein RIC55_27555 [Pirellulaceae bacterium]